MLHLQILSPHLYLANWYSTQSTILCTRDVTRIPNETHQPRHLARKTYSKVYVVVTHDHPAPTSIFARRYDSYGVPSGRVLCPGRFGRHEGGVACLPPLEITALLGLGHQYGSVNIDWEGPVFAVARTVRVVSFRCFHVRLQWRVDVL